MSAITTHVLDTSRGMPAAGVPVLLEVLETSTSWHPVGGGATDSDGRMRTLMPAGEALRVAVYRLTFSTGQYFEEVGLPTLFPRVAIEFQTAAGQSHYHVPLLLNPFGYTTYRGS